jgi:hypothetical protein
MDDGRRGRDDTGLSMLFTVISLLITALLILFALSTMFGSSNGSTKLSNQPGVALADDLTAQQTLQTSLTTADAQASESGGYGAVTPDALGTANPSITYVAGPSTSPTTVSVATTSTGTPGAGAGAGAGGGGSIAGAIAGAQAAAGAAGGDGSDSGGGGSGGSGGSGSITLAIRSTSGNCWLIWKGAGGGTWFGEQTDLPSCTAPALGAAPTASTVSSTAIGWRYGAFPGI